MNRFLCARGILQNVTGRLPGPTITAPLRERAIVSMLTEDERMAQFEHSREFHSRRYAKEQSPDTEYDSELSEGFKMKYGQA
jgi:hypothetical protein